MATWWRPPGRASGTTALSRRLLRLERELRRLQEAHRLSLAYMRGIDEDLAALEEHLPDGVARAGADRPRRLGAHEEQEPMVFVECERCHRTVGLAEGELGAFEEAIHCPYCRAELMRAWKPPAQR